MEFISEMKETFESVLPRLARAPKAWVLRNFNPIKFGNNVELSVQASFSHYCSPRTTTDLKDYTSMEIALFKDGEFISLTGLLIPHIDLMKRAEGYYEGTVYGYMPVEMIEEIYQALKETFGAGKWGY